MIFTLWIKWCSCMFNHSFIPSSLLFSTYHKVDATLGVRNIIFDGTIKFLTLWVYPWESMGVRTDKYVKWEQAVQIKISQVGWESYFTQGEQAASLLAITLVKQRSTMHSSGEWHSKTNKRRTVTSKTTSWE